MTTTQVGSEQSEAVAAFAAFLMRNELRPESLWALRQAAMATDSEGISGVLVVKVPRRESGQVDVQFTSGSAQISLEF